MRSLEALTKARLQGAKPEVVFVTLGGCRQSPWWQDGSDVEVVIPDEAPIARIDFRPLVGCAVILIAWQRDARLRVATERICAQAERVTVLSSANPDDLGHVWIRGRGLSHIGAERRAA